MYERPGIRFGQSSGHSPSRSTTSMSSYPSFGGYRVIDCESEGEGVAAWRIQEAKLILMDLEERVMSPQLTAPAELIQERHKDSPPWVVVFRSIQRFGRGCTNSISCSVSCRASLVFMFVVLFLSGWTNEMYWYCHVLLSCLVLCEGSVWGEGMRVGRRWAENWLLLCMRMVSVIIHQNSLLLRAKAQSVCQHNIYTITSPWKAPPNTQSRLEGKQGGSETSSPDHLHKL